VCLANRTGVALLVGTKTTVRSAAPGPATADAIISSAVSVAPTAEAPPCHPRGPFPSVRYYASGGTARLTSVPLPASAALPCANDLLAAGAVVLAADDTGIRRSDDDSATWRHLVGGLRAWSIAAIPGGGYAVLGSRDRRQRASPRRPCSAAVSRAIGSSADG
jgi:hypothetical protein